MHSLLFFLNALAFLRLSSKSLKFRPVVFSIPIAPSKNPIDAVEFTGFPPREFAIKIRVLDVVGREIRPRRGFGREIFIGFGAEISTDRFSKESQNPLDAKRAKKLAALIVASADPEKNELRNPQLLLGSFRLVPDPGAAEALGFSPVPQQSSAASSTCSRRLARREVSLFLSLLIMLPSL